MYGRRRARSLRRSKGLLLTKSVMEDFKRLPRSIQQLSEAKKFPALGSLNKSGTPLKASCRGCAPSPRPAIEDPEACCVRPCTQCQAPHSRLNRNRHRPPVLLDQGTQPTISHQSLDSGPPFLPISPPPPVPPPRPGRPGPQARFSCCATSAGHHPKLLEFDRRLKVDNDMRSSPWAHNLSWVGLLPTAAKPFS